MQDGQPRYQAHANSTIGRQYTSAHSTRHRSVDSTRRLIFFGLSSIWGYLVGVAGLFAAIGVEGQRLASDAGVFALLIPSLMLAALGSFVVAAAYKEAKRRSRR